MDKKILSSRLQKEERFLHFWNEKDLSKVDYIRTLVTVASVSNNLSWIFFSAYQCAIRHHFKQKINSTISLAVREISNAPIKTTFDNKKNILLLTGKKSWLVSTNVDLILLYVKLREAIEFPLNNKTNSFNSVLVPLYKEKSTIRETFKKVKFLRNLNQGSLTLKKTKITSETIFSGKKIRGFGYIEQFFVMLSLGIFFVTKVNNIKYKRMFFKKVKALIIDFNTRNSPKMTVRFHKKSFKKMIHIFDSLPERKVIIGWEYDKNIFFTLLK